MTTLYPIHTQTLLSKGHNLRRDTEILTAETHKLEALGVVLRKRESGVLHLRQQPTATSTPRTWAETTLSNQEQRGSVLIVIEDMSVALRNRFVTLILEGEKSGIFGLWLSYP